MRTLLATVRPYLAVVTRLGWGFAVTAVALWVVGSILGWAELRIAAVGMSVLDVLAVFLTIGGTKLRLRIWLLPPRVLAGGTSRATLTAVNRGRQSPPAMVEVPVGQTVATFAVPSLRPAEQHRSFLDVPTSRRGVITVGPVTTVRGDPFGLARREVSRAEAVELFVHPEVVPLPSLDAGLVRDLEGRATSDPSSSDLDFHTLRSYHPGDERRHIHWRSSARATAASGSTTLLVKSYTDTRRSHLGVVFDARAASYVDDDAFEAGIVAAASVTVRALRDEMDVTVVAGDHAVDRTGIPRTLDAFARVEPTGTDLPALAARLMTLAPSTSIVLLVTGSENAFTDLRRSTAQFGPQVRVLALRVRPGQPGSVASAYGLTVLSMGELADLARLIGAGGLA